MSIEHEAVPSAEHSHNGHSGAAAAPSLTLDSGLTVRPWHEGDDVKLLEVWGDAEGPMHHQDRALLRPSSNEPWARCIVAEYQGVPVAAATILRSTLHPDRLSFYVEVAPEHRRKGVAVQLLQILEAEVPNCDVQSLKARCERGSAAQCFLKDNGFTKIQASRQVVVQPGALPLPDIEDSGLELQDMATGSVELTQIVADFYNSVHTWDRAEMTLGRAQRMLLAPQTGASGVVVLRESSDDDQLSGSPRGADLPAVEGEEDAEVRRANQDQPSSILAFAISYTDERTEEPADVLLGWNAQLDDDQAGVAAQTLLAFISARYPVSVEVDDAMAPLKRVTKELIAREAADVDIEALIYARDVV